jgi:ABC-type multidrug transport system fused ATPase/permease subunit
MNAVGSSDRIFQLFDRKSSVPNVGGARPPDGLRGVIQLKDVSFAYPTRPDVLVLDRVSLTVTPGTVLALCGPSGSGKSSIVHLLERFYDPQHGLVLVDDVPLTKLDASWWRKRMALVAQEPVLFGCSVFDNITYGVLDADNDAVVQAARTANAHEFVANFPEGYKTLVGERGVQLSGGQKQRIAIARALLVDPRILLLDEATSALDAESEHVVQEAIDRLMNNRTTVLIAHRLSTVQQADTICVVQRGRIVERGTHEALFSQSGIYAQLVQRQMGSNQRPSGPSEGDRISHPEE